jgi:hypothetical protein
VLPWSVSWLEGLLVHPTTPRRLALWVGLSLGTTPPAPADAATPPLLRVWAAALGEFSPPPRDAAGEVLLFDYAGAQVYCQQRSEHHGQSLRLPTARELADLWALFGAKVVVPPARLRKLRIPRTVGGEVLRGELESMFGPEFQSLYRVYSTHLYLDFLYQGPADTDLRDELDGPLADFLVDGVWTSTPTRSDHESVYVFAPANAERFWAGKADAPTATR